MLNWFIWIIKAHGTQLLSLENIELAGSEECQTEEEHQNIKIVYKSVCYNAYALLISGNMWNDTNILKIQPNGTATFKKTHYPSGWNYNIYGKNG